MTVSVPFTDPAPDTGGAPASSPRRLTALAVLGRGVGQVFFQRNALTGLLIVAGVTAYRPLMALQVVLGAAVSTAAASVMGHRTEDGLHGYNGALVGAAAWAATGATWPATLATLVGAAACPVVHTALDRVVGRAGLPLLTAPFCVISGLVTMLLESVGRVVPTAQPVAADGRAPWLLVRAVLTGVSQVVLAESWLAGALILVGLFVAGWRVGTAALLGSVIGTVLTAATTSVRGAADGLGGYSPCLTAIALAVVLIPRSRTAWGLAVIGAVATTLLGWFFMILPIPTYTWPFVVTTWAVLLMSRSLPGTGRAWAEESAAQRGRD